MCLPRRKLVQKKEKGGRDTKRIRSWSSFRITGNAILHQTMGVYNIRAWPSSTAWLLGDIANCAAYRRVLPKRGYVLCTEAQELTSLNWLLCSHLYVLPFLPSPDPSASVWHQLQLRSTSVLHCPSCPIQRWLRNYLIDIDAILLHVGLVVHLSPFHKLHEKDTPCWEFPVDPGDLKQEQMGYVKQQTGEKRIYHTHPRKGVKEEESEEGTCFLPKHMQGVKEVYLP